MPAGGFDRMSIFSLQGTSFGPPSDGMNSWFRSKDADSLWNSAIILPIQYVAAKLSGNDVTVKTESGHGATVPVRSVQGDSATIYNFDSADSTGLIDATFTLCSLSRYTGTQRGAILIENTGSNFFHGHYAGLTGVAKYGDTFKTDMESHSADAEDWVAMCGQNAAPDSVIVNGRDVKGTHIIEQRTPSLLKRIMCVYDSQVLAAMHHWVLGRSQWTVVGTDLHATRAQIRHLLPSHAKQNAVIFRTARDSPLTTQSQNVSSGSMAALMYRWQALLP
jgi:hypothetical protein